MKRIAVILGVTAAALVTPTLASATGVVQQGLGSSPGSARPQTGVVVQGVSTSPRITSPRITRPATGVVAQGFGTSPRALYPHVLTSILRR